MKSCIFTYDCLIYSSCLLNKLLLKMAEGSFSIYFAFLMMNLFTFIAFLNVFRYFAKVD